MATNIPIASYFSNLKHQPLIDVRSPGEFDKGHIPGAVNIPLFTNDERAHVGTVYKNEGQEKAIALGYEYVNPKLDWFIEQSAKIAPNKNVAVHCWRGGMRSHAFADHLKDNGFNEVSVITGGYKAYRNHVLSSFEQDIDLKVLGGYTGSGKTRILKVLKSKGEQIIDLEALAHHKGSAFGSIGERQQPTVEQFENNLFEVWRDLDFKRHVFIEDESHNIGSVVIPKSLFDKIRLSEVLFLDIPKEKRANLLVEDYTNCDNKLLEQAIYRIKKRLGGLNTSLAIEALEKNNYHEVAMITLQYYDKSYLNGLSRREESKITNIVLNDVDAEENANQILTFLNN